MFFREIQIDEEVFKKQLLPKVSIVTPSFNQAGFLEATIQSVLAQDYPNIEYIVIDGGSADGSAEIIKKYADKLAYWVSESDRGQGHAINKGFSKASGNIFYWLNSDDLVMPSAVKIAVACFLSNPDIGMIYGDRIVIDAKGNILRMEEYPSFSKRWMMYNLKIPQETVFFRRELFCKAGGVDENLHACMDYDLWIRYGKIGKIRHIPFILGAYRNHQDAKSLDVSKIRAEVRKIIDRYFGKRRSRKMKKFYKYYIAFCLSIEKAGKKRKEIIKKVEKLINTSVFG